jgi:hypothetical protein
VINFIILMGILNMLGGRWSDVAGDDFPINGKLLMRCIASGVAAGGLALDSGMGAGVSAYIASAVMAGSALWYPFGWSFAEQHGVDDPAKYPKLVRKIGHWIFPVDLANPADRTQTRRRGIVMKGLRGAFDILTFGLLSFINPWALAWFFGTLLMGLIYYLASRVVSGTRYDVMFGEDVYGMWRGFLIAKAMGL